MSASVEVRCGICDVAIGDQFDPGDGERLFRAHLAEAHPREARGIAATESAQIRIPWPPR